ncbi:hypothetical protein FRB98_007409 [Tulasnella sp. 332]|nr:hypothetical protein FRB98_007409 [Tulasnella sp. 332]
MASNLEEFWGDSVGLILGILEVAVAKDGSGLQKHVYGAPRPYLEHQTHSKQEICLDSSCYSLDVEHAYTTVDSNLEHQPVLL